MGYIDTREFGSSNKGKILLLSPEFFGYYKEIKRNITKRGYHVDVILENFAEKSNMYRFFYVKNKKTRNQFAKKYYMNEFREIDNGYDYILVIRGEALSDELLAILKANNPQAEFVMYQWDSVKNNPNALTIKNFFDRIYTFDIDDAKAYGWKYRPLFFENADTQEKKEIDFSFIGTLYYKRAVLLKKIKTYCDENNDTLFDYIYCPKIVYLLHRYILRDERYSILNNSEVKFLPLDGKLLKKQYGKTRILVDYTADDQTGLTMRTIESLGYNCKLITNNKRIKETDIYEYGNIYIYDIDDFHIPNEFVSSEFKRLPDKVLYYYSINGWVDCILGEESKEYEIDT